MELYPIDIAIHLLNIIVLYVLLRLLVWKPVRKFMAGREERIQSQLDAAAKAQADAQASQTEYKQKLAAAQTTCEQLMAEGRKQAAVSGQKILAQAQEEAGRILEKAHADAQEEKVRAMDDARVSWPIWRWSWRAGYCALTRRPSPGLPRAAATAKAPVTAC